MTESPTPQCADPSVTSRKPTMIAGAEFFGGTSSLSFQPAARGLGNTGATIARPRARHRMYRNIVGGVTGKEKIASCLSSRTQWTTIRDGHPKGKRGTVLPTVGFFVNSVSGQIILPPGLVRGRRFGGDGLGFPADRDKICLSSDERGWTRRKC